MKLPDPIARFFARDANPSALAACFAEDAVVVDEKHMHRGRAAIAAWNAAAVAKYHHTTVPTSLDGAVVTARVTGTFPGSPIDLRYRFTLAGDLIARLEITP